MARYMIIMVLIYSSRMAYCENTVMYPVIYPSWEGRIQNIDMLFSGKVLELCKTGSGEFIVDNHYVQIPNNKEVILKGIWHHAKVYVDNPMKGNLVVGEISVRFFTPDQSEGEWWGNMFSSPRVGRRYVFCLEKDPGNEGLLRLSLSLSLIAVADTTPPDLQKDDDMVVRMQKESIFAMKMHARDDNGEASGGMVLDPYWRGELATQFLWERANREGLSDFMRRSCLYNLARHQDAKAIRMLWKMAKDDPDAMRMCKEYRTEGDITVAGHYLIRNLFGTCTPQRILGILPDLATSNDKAVKYALATYIYDNARKSIDYGRYYGSSDQELIPLLIILLQSEDRVTSYTAYKSLYYLEPGIAETLPATDIYCKSIGEYRKICLDWWEKEGKKKYPSLEESLAKFAKEVAEQEKKDTRDSKRTGDDGKWRKPRHGR